MSTSVELAPSQQKRCFCALCTNTFLRQEDNLYRRRNLHDLCRLMEDGTSPPMEPKKKDDLFFLLENELKKRQVISLCTGCNIMVGSLLREIGIAKEYEASVIRQQKSLKQDLIGLERHNVAVYQHFSLLKDTLQSADAEDFKFHAIRDMETGLKLFRERLVEMTKDLEKYCINVQQRQLVLQGPGNPSAMDYLSLPVQLQVEGTNPTPGSSELLALPPPPEVNRKREASRSLEDEDNKPPKLLKSLAADTNGGPPKPDFKERMISRAQKPDAGIDDILLSAGVVPSLQTPMVYDAAKDRLAFGDITIVIDKENRKLICGKCQKEVKQNVKKPGEFYKLERNLKLHVLQKHFNITEFNCSRCGKGFNRKASLTDHFQKCNQQTAVENDGGSVQSDGDIKVIAEAEDKDMEGKLNVEESHDESGDEDSDDTIKISD